MIHENILCRNAKLHSRAFHGVDFIIFAGAMVAAHNQFAHGFLCIQADAGIDPVIEHMAQLS